MSRNYYCKVGVTDGLKSLRYFDSIKEAKEFIAKDCTDNGIKGYIYTIYRGDKIYGMYCYSNILESVVGTRF